MKLRKRLITKMKLKGWEPHFVNKTLEILEKAEKDKGTFIVFLDKSMYWFGLVVSLLGNFVISFALIPIYLFTPLYVVLPVTLLFALCFGFLIDLFIRDIDYIGTKHYIIAGLFLPLIAIFNMVLTKKFINDVSTVLLVNQPNTYIIGSTYLISFLKPHLLRSFLEHKKQ